MKARRGVLYDLVEIARIYNAAAKEPHAVVDFKPATEVEAREWLSGAGPLMVVVDGEKILGFAHAQPRRVWSNESKTADLRVFVDPKSRRKGVAKLAVRELVTAARTMGLWKLLAYLPAQNTPGRRLLATLEFREVGVLMKHIQLASGWQDVVIHERLLMASRPSSPQLPPM